MTDRYCAHAACGKLLVKRGAESYRDFARRVFCDLACRRSAEAGKRGQRVCPFCTKPYGPKGNSEFALTCGEPACRSALLSQRATAHVGWPQITGEVDFGNGFANNIITKSRGRMPTRPDTRSLTGSTTALLYRGAGE